MGLRGPLHNMVFRSGYRPAGPDALDKRSSMGLPFWRQPENSLICRIFG